MQKAPRKTHRMMTGLLVLLMGSVGIVGTATAASAAVPKCNITSPYMLNPYQLWVPGYDNGNSATLDCYMKRGQRDQEGNPVQTLQRALNKCYGFTLSPDGSFGPATENAVKYVQRYEGVTIDGSVGPETKWTMMWPLYKDGVFVGCWSRWA